MSLQAEGHRRDYNREYMRRWRAQPENAEREKANRSAYDFRRKLSRAKEPEPTNRCEFCRERICSRTVSRLVSLPDGYKRVTRRCCDECYVQDIGREALPLEETTSLGLASILGIVIRGGPIR